MATRSTTNTIMWIVGAVILIGLVVWALVRILNYYPTGFQSNAPPPVASTTAEGNNVGPSTAILGETYTNSTYGFSISYPAEFRTGPFSVFHALRNGWRVNAPSDIRGTPVMAILVSRMDKSTSTGKSYPLFFDAEVRVGVSDNIARCYEVDGGYTLNTVTDMNINGVTWKKFIFGDAAMMQYLSGASYRTIHNDKCYVIEQIRTGSTYKDDTMSVKHSDEELDALYAKTTPIVMSFKFTEK